MADHAVSGRDAAVASRNAAWVVIQRGSQIVGGVLFASLVPRLMGPTVFGQYALVTSVSMWFALLSGLGAVSMMTRTVPGFVVRQDHDGLRRLVSGLAGLRAGIGVLAAVLYLALTMNWLHEIGTSALLFIAGAVLIRTVTNIMFALFLGLNQAARWGIGDTLRSWLSFALALAGYQAAGLEGACFGYLAAHAVVLATGVWMARGYLDARALVPDLAFLAPFLRTGASFAAGNVLLALSQRTGEALVHLSTADFAEVGYFGAAYGIYVAGAQVFWHFAVSYAPMLVEWREQGEVASIRRWLRRLSVWIAAAAILGAALAMLVGRPAVGLVFGPAYLPVADNLMPLSLAMVAMAFSCIGRLRALVADRPAVAGVAAGLELAVFWIVGLALTPQYGSYGTSVAVLVGASTNAGFALWRLRADLPAQGPASET